MHEFVSTLTSWDLPQLGTATLYAVLVACGYTFAIAALAGAGRPRLLRAARFGAYATSATVLFAIFLLAYGFVTHDFRIRYVAHYSNRGMDLKYLLTALWGGQDGSLLWWLLLLSGFVSSCVYWMGGKYRALQPHVIATLMIIMAFFGLVMLFAANPFETEFAGAPLDGEGLNPALQDIYMIIHPPSLYTGFVACSIPFAFSVAALVTGRLDNEWVTAVRKWMLFAWLFLTIGNALGMLWAYKELGWGGYWAWDPVENAACLPWFTASAYLHSTMIQERRNMFRNWNIFLIATTFFLTIFGTFLTRSGIIASVHSFAKSDIGIFFVVFMAFIIIGVGILVLLRRKELRGDAAVESLLSREAAFVVNNWALLSCALFIGGVTMWPKISEWLWDENITVGPPFYNRWLAPVGLGILFLMAAAPLLGWRKTSQEALRKAFRAPVIAGVVTMLLHLLLGKMLGFPAFVSQASHYDGFFGAILNGFSTATPWITVGFVAFNSAVVIQEFIRGIQARRKGTDESVLAALIGLFVKARRRYGGYLVHFGIGLMFLGFVGKAWELESEAKLLPGDATTLGAYELEYSAFRSEVDPGKRMMFADITVKKDGRTLGTVSPGKFIYKNTNFSPTSEVGLMAGLREDVYVVVGMIDPKTKKGTFRFHINPMVSFIWFGVLVMMLGSVVSLWPEVRLRELGAWGAVRMAAGTAGVVMFSVMFASTPAHAIADPVAQAQRAAQKQMIGVPPAKLPWSAPIPIAAGLLLAAVHLKKRKEQNKENES